MSSKEKHETLSCDWNSLTRTLTLVIPTYDLGGVGEAPEYAKAQTRQWWKGSYPSLLSSAFETGTSSYQNDISWSTASRPASADYKMVLHAKVSFLW